MYNGVVKVGSMRKNILISVFCLLFLALTGCTSGNDVKVYEDTEEINISHKEISMTAVLLNINLEENIVRFMDCRTGVERSLRFHGGVRVNNSHDDEISVAKLMAGSVVDVVYYEDTAKLVSITENKSAKTITNVKKFSANKDKQKAAYKGISINMSEHAVAINHDGGIMDVSEINMEDMVTLSMYASKLVAVIVDEGHGYVRLSNQSTYIGGMVEIGYDVIVPVTDNMLLAVREGDYTLRINNRGYSQTKQITVKRDTETLVDLGDIAIPTGTAVFEVEPSDAKIYVSGNEISGHTYTNLYGSYTIRVEAEGYKTYRGSFKIKDAVDTIKIKLREDEDATTEEPSTDSTKDTESTEGSTTEIATPMDASSTEDTGTNDSADSTQSTDLSDTESGDGSSEDASADDGETSGTGTEEGVETNNLITINTPALAGVYVDGDYIGIAPISFTKVTGTHTVTLYRSGYLIKSYTINAEDNGKDDIYNFAELITLLDLIE